MNIQDRALDLINQLQQAFFEQDMNRIIAVLDDEITWVGNDTQKIVQGLKQAEDMLLAEAETCKSLVFQNSWYRAMPVFEDTCLVYGVVEVQRKMPSMEMTDMQLRIFAICRLRDDKMLLSQFHVSPPEGNNQEETATDTDGTRETDGLLKEVSDKQCPGTNETNRVLKALIDIIPGGVQQRRFDSYLTILYLSDGFCTMFGYTREEIEENFHMQYIRMIHPDDRALVKKQIRKQLTRGNTAEIQYRVVCKDDSVVWVLDKGQLVVDEGGQEFFCCILVDITNTKQDQEELRLSLERHRIIMDQTNDIIFEWDIHSDRLVYSLNWEKKFGYPPFTEESKKNFPYNARVHPDDRSRIMGLFDQILQGAPYTEAEGRIKTSQGNYIWCRIRATTQYDKDHHPISAIGVIIDIDEEKKQSQKLVEKAQRDTLTHLYNKGASQSLIEEYFSECSEQELHALMIIDLDNFKRINDQMGHLYGDQVLMDTATVIKKLFRSSDIIGRIGGDEFIVFLKNIQGHLFAVDKAKKIISQVQQIAIDEKRLYKISCSLGVALFPAHGKSFLELYQKADYALYQAKKMGKNRYVFYDNDQMDSALLSLPNGFTDSCLEDDA